MCDGEGLKESECVHVWMREREIERRKRENEVTQERNQRQASAKRRGPEEESRITKRENIGARNVAGHLSRFFSLCRCCISSVQTIYRQSEKLQYGEEAPNGGNGIHEDYGAARKLAQKVSKIDVLWGRGVSERDREEREGQKKEDREKEEKQMREGGNEKDEETERSGGRGGGGEEEKEQEGERRSARGTRPGTEGSRRVCTSSSGLVRLHFAPAMEVGASDQRCLRRELTEQKSERQRAAGA